MRRADRRIAVLAGKGVGEAQLQAVERLTARIARHRAAAGVVELPQIVDAVAMIGMVVGPDHCLDVVDVGIEQLLAKVRAGVDQDPHPLPRDQDRRPPPPFPRLGGIALPPVVADARHPRRGARAEDADLHQAPFANRIRKFPDVRSARPSTDSPRKSARKRAVSATNAGSHGLPRCGTGARKGESVSISSRSAGRAFAVSCRSLAFLNVTMPEMEMNRPRSNALRAKSALAVKQWMTPG